MDQASSDKIIDAICINCNKRFKSMRAVSMHLRITGTRHAVNITNNGHYDKKTGLREIIRSELNFNLSESSERLITTKPKVELTVLRNTSDITSDL